MEDDERRAITAAGPTNHIISREDLLVLIDTARDAQAEADRCAQENRLLRIVIVGSLSLWLWQISHHIIGWP